ncbi:MAG: GntP family permease [Planctomycetales bacterium]|nr:GntP family permease [Planctomycetales bacterium]
MSAVSIMFFGMAVVICGILLFRWHAFLALLAGATTVAFLTDSQTVYETEVARLVRVIEANAEVASFSGFDAIVLDSECYVYRQVDSNDKPSADCVRWFHAWYEPQGKIRLLDTDAWPEANSLDAKRFNSSYQSDNNVQLTSGDLLINAADHDDALRITSQSAIDRIAFGFGDTCRKIGILIALAAIIGSCLLESGAANRIVQSICSVVGERRTPLAFVLSGFTVGIPVFFDTVFYLLLPLAKAMYRQSGKNYVLYVMAVVVGGTMAHSLVPPTPGPMFVAEKLNVSLGTMMLAGIGVGLFSSFAGFVYASLTNRWWPIVPHELNQTETPDHSANQIASPPLWLSLLPILLPVVLLSSTSVGIELAEWPSWWQTKLELLSDKNVALGISAIIALILLWRYPGRLPAQQAVSAAITGAGGIILITAAGGAFGHVLRQTGIAVELQQQFMGNQSGFILLWLAFGLTALVRVAQGSATVAMITSVGIIAPLAAATALPFHPVYLALAVGCGSKPLPWMNDSGFWFVGKMSGFTERETLRTFSVTLTIMGIAGFSLILLAAKIWPGV